ncbi:MAG: hypothetical protein IPG74_08020 [Flavobacteriales bacterium]|nr:hypothetical protein [Flavobacteriales bacterium]
MSAFSSVERLRYMTSIGPIRSVVDRVQKSPLVGLLLILSYRSFGQQVDAGNGHALILDEHGVAWAVGRNDHGQLGDSTFSNRNAPIRISGLPPLRSLARGYDHSIGLDSAGRIWTWGNNSYGQLARRERADGPVPAMVEGHRGFKQVAGGHWHSIALKEDGTVWSWGHNYFGDLGSGDREHRSHPVPVVIESATRVYEPVRLLKGIVSIATVGYHGLALDKNGQVWAWGPNDYGQLGTGEGGVRTFAAHVPGMSRIAAIAVGWHHSMALDSGGVIWAWGSDPATQHHETIGTFRTTPSRVEDLPGIETVVCGSWHTLALDSSGGLWAWGKNHFGMLGTGDTISRSLPVQVDSIPKGCRIGAGCFQSLVVDSTGTIWTFGDNPSGQLGFGAGPGRSLVPVRMGKNVRDTWIPPTAPAPASAEASKAGTDRHWWIMVFSIVLNALLLWSLWRKRGV